MGQAAQVRAARDRGESVCDYVNYETFTVAMLMTNNSAEVYEKWRKRGRELQAAFPEVQVPGGWSDACIKLGDEIKEWCEKHTPTLYDRTKLGLYEQMLSAAFERVDWREVADDFLTE